MTLIKYFLMGHTCQWTCPNLKAFLLGLGALKGNREANGNAIGHGRRKRKEAPQKRAKTKAKSNGKTRKRESRERGDLRHRKGPQRTGHLMR